MHVGSGMSFILTIGKSVVLRCHLNVVSQNRIKSAWRNIKSNASGPQSRDVRKGLRGRIPSHSPGSCGRIRLKTLKFSNNRGLLENTYLGCGAAWGGHLSGRQDSRSVQIRYGPPLKIFLDFYKKICYNIYVR